MFLMCIFIKSDFGLQFLMHKDYLPTYFEKTGGFIYISKHTGDLCSYRLVAGEKYAHCIYIYINMIIC